MGYENGHKAHGNGFTMYVDGYDSLEAIQDFLEEIAAMEAAYSAPKMTGRNEKGDAR